MDNPEEKYFADMPSTRRSAFSTDPDVGRMVDFTRDGMEHLQEDLITFLDQFDEIPVGLVDGLCQTIVDYYNKHREFPSPDLAKLHPAVYHRANTPLNPRGDIKTI